MTRLDAPSAPEALHTCQSCDGSGEILTTIHVYEAGCGFSHPDVDGKPCPDCGGIGVFIDDAAPDFDALHPAA